MPQPIRLIIAGLDVQEVEDGIRKPILYFQPTPGLPGHEKPAMVLNQTNANMVKLHLGSETNDWIGKQVGLWTDPTIEFKGQLVKGLRIKMPKVEPSFDAQSNANASTAGAGAGALQTQGNRTYPAATEPSTYQQGQDAGLTKEFTQEVQPQVNNDFPGWDEEK